jgi:glycogen synthase
VWGKTGSKLYGPKSGADYIDNHKRFALFNKAAIEAVKTLPFGPGEDCVFVANDWHSALVPVLIKVSTLGPVLIKMSALVPVLIKMRTITSSL